jgi:hypothetical protein
MKLIATKSFRNVAALGLKEEDQDGKQISTVSGSPHNDHIPKGTVFSIGPDTLKLNSADLMKLAKTNASQANAISMLVHSECVGDANDPKVVEAVKLALKEDETREANARKSDTSSVNQAVVNAITSQVKGFKTV